MKMNCIRSSSHLSDSGLIPKLHSARFERARLSSSQSSYFRATCLRASTNYNKAFLPLVYSATKYKHCAPVCVYRGTNNSDPKDEAFSMVSLKNAIDKFKQEKSLVGSLRKRIRELQSNGHGGGRRPPWGGDGGSGGSEGDGGFARMTDELLQVILATFGFIFMFVLIVRGEELTRLGFDYVKFLCGAESSSRLKRAMDRWRWLYRRMTGKRPEMEEDDLLLVHEDEDNRSESSDDWLL